MSKTYTITLDDDTAHCLEVRAAIDELRPEQAIEILITHMVDTFRETKGAQRGWQKP